MASISAPGVLSYTYSQPCRVSTARWQASFSEDMLVTAGPSETMPRLSMLQHERQCADVFGGGFESRVSETLILRHTSAAGDFVNHATL